MRFKNFRFSVVHSGDRLLDFFGEKESDLGNSTKSLRFYYEFSKRMILFHTILTDGCSKHIPPLPPFVTAHTFRASREFPMGGAY